MSFGRRHHDAVGVGGVSWETLRMRVRNGRAGWDWEGDDNGFGDMVGRLEHDVVIGERQSAGRSRA